MNYHPISPDLRVPASSYMAEQEEEHRNLPLDDPYQESRVRKEWWKNLPWLRDLQIYMEDMGERQFSLLPICSLDVKHIHVTTTICERTA